MKEYLRRIELAFSLGIIDRGAVAHASVGHDDSCAVFSGGGCNCDPDVFIETTTGRVKINSDGEVEKA